MGAKAEPEREFEGFNDELVLPSSDTPKQKKSKSKKSKSKSKSRSSKSTTSSSSLASPISTSLFDGPPSRVRILEEAEEGLGDEADRIHRLDFSEHAQELGMIQSGALGGEKGRIGGAVGV